MINNYYLIMLIKSKAINVHYFLAVGNELRALRKVNILDRSFHCEGSVTQSTE